MKKFGIGLLMISLAFTACKKDDEFNDLPQDEQNETDDRAISDYLEDHYFDSEKGLIKKFDADDESDDNYQSLMAQATKLPSGVWIVKREGVTAEGPSITDNLTDSILISYTSSRFKATYNDLEEGEKAYAKYSTSFFNTIYSTGTPAWDPIFYYKDISQTLQNNGIKEEQFVIEGFVEGLKHFKATLTSGEELYNFQGAIIVPSRMAYGREFVYINGSLDPSTYRDNSFIFNFELHKIVPRNN